MTYLTVDFRLTFGKLAMLVWKELRYLVTNSGWNGLEKR